MNARIRHSSRRRGTPSLLERGRERLRQLRSQLELTYRLYAHTVTWPRVAWASVLLLVVAYVVQDRSLPEPAEADLADLDCLALNIYFEARSEPNLGKRAVGHVVMNRVEDDAFPANVCEVVRQGGERVRNGCQFSWWCDGRSDRPMDSVAWRESRSIAWDILRGSTRDPTSGALWYHAVYASPEWRNEMLKGRTIGRHIFYHRAP